MQNYNTPRTKDKVSDILSIRKSRCIKLDDANSRGIINRMSINISIEKYKREADPSFFHPTRLYCECEYPVKACEEAHGE